MYIHSTTIEKVEYAFISSVCLHVNYYKQEGPESLDRPVTYFIRAFSLLFGFRLLRTMCCLLFPVFHSCSSHALWWRRESLNTVHGMPVPYRRVLTLPLWLSRSEIIWRVDAADLKVPEILLGVTKSNFDGFYLQPVQCSKSEFLHGVNFITCFKHGFQRLFWSVDDNLDSTW